MTAAGIQRLIRKRCMSGGEPVAWRGAAFFLASVFRLLMGSRFILRQRLREAAIAIMVGCLILAPVPLATHHDLPPPADAKSAWLSGHSAHDHAGHGHSHDDDESHDRAAGHLHGHDPADHSHQFAHFPGGLRHWNWPAPQRWPRTLTGLPESAAAFGIDRPPKLADPV